MPGKFKTKHQAQNLRKHSWACLKCDHVSTTKITGCPMCHNLVQYFPSKDELLRYQQLKFEQRMNAISELKLQPAFNVVINGEHCFTYRADFEYTRGNQRVIEDVKGTVNEKYLDPVFKIKRKIVQAVFGISINILKVKR